MQSAPGSSSITALASANANTTPNATRRSRQQTTPPSSLRCLPQATTQSASRTTLACEKPRVFEQRNSPSAKRSAANCRDKRGSGKAGRKVTSQGEGRVSEPPRDQPDICKNPMLGATPNSLKRAACDLVRTGAS